MSAPLSTQPNSRRSVTRIWQGFFAFLAFKRNFQKKYKSYQNNILAPHLCVKDVYVCKLSRSMLEIRRNDKQKRTLKNTQNASLAFGKHF